MIEFSIYVTNTVKLIAELELNENTILVVYLFFIFQHSFVITFS